MASYAHKLSRPEDLGGSIHHHGWSLRIDPTARLVWPVYPFNPYANSSEASIEWAVGALSVDLHPTKPTDTAIRHRVQEIDFVLSVSDR